MTRIEKQEIWMKVEYHKKKGWFNWDEVMRMRKEMRQDLLDQLRKAGFD